MLESLIWNWNVRIFESWFADHIRRTERVITKQIKRKFNHFNLIPKPILIFGIF